MRYLNIILFTDLTDSTSFINLLTVSYGEVKQKFTEVKNWKIQNIPICVNVKIKYINLEG